MSTVLIKSDGDIRRDFPGGWPGDPQNAFNADNRTESQKAYFDYTKKLLNWRRDQPAIHRGKTLHFAPQNNVYVYFRYLTENPNEKVMVVLNNSREMQSVSLDRFAEGLKEHTSGTEVISESKIDLTQPLQIAPKTAMVIELD
jgi:glycosidase